MIQPPKHAGSSKYAMLKFISLVLIVATVPYGCSCTGRVAQNQEKVDKGRVHTALTRLPVDVLAALQEPSEFMTLSSIVSIPNSVRASFAKASKEESFSMAEPGADWQETDVVKTTLPSRRLAYVSLSNSFCVLFYELGGVGWSYRVAVFRITPNGAELSWSGFSFQKISDLKALLDAIEKGVVVQTSLL